ncbi:penicillin acylase family protein [Roseateles koreensis]|uniref:Penicillin acylase family protein n=1 Tax=Roseateles koreensis TaxID=2987526 RepID=A0ABT5KVN0_9BURK|nr:penicillin acylase family protein [Roseateles koreensis]MDC8785886.1 penicillin acylase family protein [Roseateles koreensis]
MPVRANSRSVPQLLGRALIGLALLLILLLAVAWALLRASVPQLNGRIALPGLQAPLSIGRDALGTAVLQGSQRLDLARGLGFVHAQERFFEMDLTRRSAAGELSALFGAKALERDKQRRLHRMRARLSERFAELPAADRALLEAYANGVNAGLAAQTVRPWQYLLLRGQPEAWTPVDSLLVVSEMFWMLQGTGLDAGFERAQLREQAGDALFDWLNPRGGSWDAALDGSAVTHAMSLPTPEQFDLRGPAGTAAPRATSPSTPPSLSALNSTAEAPVIGSNNWAIAGSRNAHGDGAALLADDMHLGLGVPSIWYRAQLQLGTARAVGLTLPGMPSLVVGSNGAVAWGFTNAYGQWFDWIKLPTDLPDSAVQQFTETIAVKGEAPQTLQVREFKGAPIVRTLGKQNYALRWIAHQGQAFNLDLDHLLQARNVDEAISIAQGAGIPHQNILLADAQGHIAWTIAGRLWTQAGVAQSYARFQVPDVPQHTWTPSALYPLVKDPKGGQLWTANNRQIDGESLGDGGFDLGARAQQIRDRLRERATHDEQSLAAVHLDNEARFLKTWGQRLNQVLTRDAKYAATAAQLQAWNGRADADQVGYRLIRAVRLKTLDTLWTAWTLPLLGEQQLDEKRRLPWRAQFEYSATAALDQQPAHLLPKGFADWNALLLAQVDAAVQELTHSGQQALSQATWGQHNTSHIQHVLSKAIPALGPLLDMPARPQGGDSNLPHVAAAAFGQSERLVVSPGHEERAMLSMPGGQSGHPLSPFYGAGHQDWVEAKPTPLLAGTALHHLEAVPAQ